MRGYKNLGVIIWMVIEIPRIFLVMDEMPKGSIQSKKIISGNLKEFQNIMVKEKDATKKTDTDPQRD